MQLSSPTVKHRPADWVAPGWLVSAVSRRRFLPGESRRLHRYNRLSAALGRRMHSAPRARRQLAPRHSISTIYTAVMGSMSADYQLSPLGLHFTVTAEIIHQFFAFLINV